METFAEQFIKSKEFKLIEDINALDTFLQVKDEDLIHKGCLIEDLQSFANGYITFLDKNGEKKILTDEDVANFQPEIIEGKRLYRIDFVIINQKRLAQNEDDFKEIWEYWLNKTNINPLIASVKHLKELLISETQSLQKLHKENTSSKNRDINLLNLSDMFINYLTKPASATVEDKNLVLFQREIALIYHYENWLLTDENANDEVRKYLQKDGTRHKSGKALMADYRIVNGEFKDWLNQKIAIKYLKKIIPLLQNANGINDAKRDLEQAIKIRESLF